jgi:hypothetical protein
MELMRKLDKMRRDSYTYADKDIIPVDGDSEEFLVEF